MLSKTTAICWSESNSASLHQTQGASQAIQQLAASKAAAALRHAAEAWAGGEDVVRWLEARAEHIESVGLYDGETWP